MLDLVTAIQPDVAAALSPMPGGLYRKDGPDGFAVVPSWWIHADSSGRLSTMQDAVPVTLDVWHETIGDLDDALLSLEFLRDYIAEAGTFTRESVTVMHEDRNVHHASILLMAKRFVRVA